MRRTTESGGPTETPDGPGEGQGRTLFVKLTADEAKALDGIVAARQAETPDRKVSISEIVRGWIRQGGPRDA